jgi:LmbE family N-acetylglucosaminyl deacetylase
MPAAIAIAAHPDDIEFFMSGTLIHLRNAGWEIHYMNVANGCCGSMQYDRETTTLMRREEAKRAAARLGAVFHESLTADIEVFYEKATLAKVASVIREVAPQIVLTHPPSDYMEDHQNVCRLAVTAAFCRGMPNFPVDPPRPAIDAKVTVYHAQPFGNRDPLGELVLPHIYVDTTAVVEEKVAALAEHVSQKHWLDVSQGHDSYLKTLRELDAEVGRMSGRYRYAEGWRRHRYLGFCGPDDNPLVDALADRVLVPQVE